MAQSNRIDLTDRKGKGKGKLDATDYVMPRFPLPRRTALDWNGYTRQANGVTRLYVNIHKEPEALDLRMARALGITLDEYKGLPEVIKEREMRNINTKSAPVPASFTPTDIQMDCHLEFANDATFKPRLVHTGDTLDVDTFADLATVAQMIYQKSIEQNAQDVPLKFVLDSFGVLELRPVTSKDAADGNAEKITHFTATNHRTDATALANAIHITQKKRRDDRTQPKAPPSVTPPANSEIDANTKEPAKVAGK